MKIDRLVAIIMVLMNCDRISASRLAEKFEVTTRTIYRDIDTIAMAGIPIVTYPGVNGGIGIMPEYKVDKQFFSGREISNLMMGLGTVSTTLSQKDVAGTLEKVKRLVPAEQAADLEAKAGQIRIDLAAWGGSRQVRPDLELIRKAQDQHRVLAMAYRGRDGALSRRRVEPYQLVFKAGHWYLQAFCLLREDFRIFKLARISRLDLLEDRFAPRPFEPNPMDGTGWIDNRLIRIQLRVHNSLEEQVREYCDADDIAPCGRDMLMVNLPFTEDEYGYRFLIGLGDQCECIGPARVRKALIRRIRNMLAVYDDR